MEETTPNIIILVEKRPKECRIVRLFVSIKRWITGERIAHQMTKTKFISEQEYVKSFTDRGLSVPPFLVFQEYVIRDGVPGYLVPVPPDEKKVPDGE